MRRDRHHNAPGGSPRRPMWLGVAQLFELLLRAVVKVRRQRGFHVGRYHALQLAAGLGMICDHLLSELLPVGIALLLGDLGAFDFQRIA